MPTPSRRHGGFFLPVAAAYGWLLMVIAATVA
jgi:hypothetical protein